MADLKELLAQKAALDQKIIEVQRAARDSAIADVRRLMAEHGLSVADIGTRGTGGKSGPRKGSRQKVAAKYRDPANGNAWSGRGLQPNWLRAAVANGRKLSDFAI